MNNLLIFVVVLVGVLTKKFTKAEDLSDPFDQAFDLKNSSSKILETSNDVLVDTTNGSSRLIQRVNENPTVVTDLDKKVRNDENLARNKRSDPKYEDTQLKKSYYALISGCKLIPTDELPPVTAYYLCDTRMDWHSAHQHCKRHQMNLAVTITNHVFTNLVRSLYHSYIQNRNSVYYRAWLGGTDLGSVGNWYWDRSRTPIMTNLWYSGEPNNVNGNEHCLGLGQVGSTSEFGLFDLDCQGQYEFLCEAFVYTL